MEKRVILIIDYKTMYRSTWSAMEIKIRNWAIIYGKLSQVVIFVLGVGKIGE